MEARPWLNADTVTSRAFVALVRVVKDGPSGLVSFGYDDDIDMDTGNSTFLVKRSRVDRPADPLNKLIRRDMPV